MNEIQELVENFKSCLVNISKNPMRPVMIHGEYVFVEKVNYRWCIDETTEKYIGQIDLQLRSGRNIVGVRSPFLFVEGLKTWLYNIILVAETYAQELSVVSDELLTTKLALENANEQS